MNPWLSFAIGMFVCAGIAIIAISLCCVAARGSREEEIDEEDDTPLYNWPTLLPPWINKKDVEE